MPCSKTEEKVLARKREEKQRNLKVFIMSVRHDLKELVGSDCKRNILARKTSQVIGRVRSLREGSGEKQKKSDISIILFHRVTSLTLDVHLTFHKLLRLSLK